MLSKDQDNSAVASSARLQRDPVWAPDSLGQPLPDSPHAVSVSLPTWPDVIGYEEREPRVMHKLRGGYPRFAIPSAIRELSCRLAPDAEVALPFPSRRVAQRAAQFVTTHAKTKCTITTSGSLTVATCAEAGRDALHAYWQHAGEIVSSRQAEAALHGAVGETNGNEARRRIRQTLATLYSCRPEDVFLYPTGMAAIAATLRAVHQRQPGRHTAQLGFPYVDSLKLQRTMGSGVNFVPDVGDTLAARVARDLTVAMPAAFYCEVPSNPLLHTPDLAQLSPLLRAKDIPLVVDDVVATPINVDVTPYADLIVVSLTKYAAGTGDVMGGAAIVPPTSPFYGDLHARLLHDHEELLWDADARVLSQQMDGWGARMQAHNRNGLHLAHHLRNHPKVARTWYPKWEHAEAYEALRRHDGGWGGLLSFTLKNPAQKTPEFYQRLELCKGPSLGTEFTLVCPFTMLAHYNELQWAESHGVSRYLIRISAGIEDPADLSARLDAALSGI